VIIGALLTRARRLLQHRKLTSAAAYAGQHLVGVHPAAACAGRVCVIHAPTAHHMRDWPIHWHHGIFERICPHGVGHPDPDQYPHWAQRAAAWRPSLAADILDGPAEVNPWPDMGVHGCCGCCSAAV